MVVGSLLLAILGDDWSPDGIDARSDSPRCDPHDIGLYLQPRCYAQFAAGEFDLVERRWTAPLVYQYSRASWYGLNPDYLPVWMPVPELAGNGMAFPPHEGYDPFNPTVAATPLWPKPGVPVVGSGPEWWGNAPFFPGGARLRVWSLWGDPCPMFGYPFVDVVVLDTCPGCGATLSAGIPWVDLSPAAYTRLAPLQTGLIPVVIEHLTSYDTAH
jgi:hypothetical protein